jgi:glutamate 5-kinase
MIHGREDLGNAERVVIKIGTSVLSPSGGFLNLTNMANIVEKAAQLYHEGKEVLIVSSGAAGVGRQLMARQNILRRSMAELLNPNRFDETSIDGASKEMNKASV